MKKNLLTGFTGIFLSMVISITANGQLASTKMKPSEDISYSEKLVTKNANAVDRKDVNSRVVKNFARSYKNVLDEKWFEVKYGFVTIFNHDDISFQVTYDKKGNMLRTIRSYGETHMSPALRHIVKS